ncbi:hypothetical protein ACFWY9_12005 [Amycolatopsis sp. NPDC059027]|uniref:hypothetical protein n=1 Tax=Amycolatopsis sp. NPDC059027 TaxID=3346709 RepID=UPI003670ED60
MADEVDVAELSQEQRRRGVRTVASAALDAQDCALLLDILGLDAADGVVKDTG